MTAVFHASEPKVKLPYHIWTVAEYHQMAGAGLLDESDRVELIEGELVDMAPIGSRHAFLVDRIAETLGRGSRAAHMVRVQNPVLLGERSEPQPDIALVKRDNYADRHPGPDDILLIIEVSDTTLEYDRDVKLALYARHGIPEVWLIDVNAGELTVYCEPAEGQFRLIRKPTAAEAVLPTLVPDISLRWAELVV
jgi:Uma2 family endonuclease